MPTFSVSRSLYANLVTLTTCSGARIVYGSQDIHDISSMLKFLALGSGDMSPDAWRTNQRAEVGLGGSLEFESRISENERRRVSSS